MGVFHRSTGDIIDLLSKYLIGIVGKNIYDLIFCDPINSLIEFTGISPAILTSILVIESYFFHRNKVIDPQSNEYKSISYLIKQIDKGLSFHNEVNNLFRPTMEYYNDLMIKAEQQEHRKNMVAMAKEDTLKFKEKFSAYSFNEKKDKTEKSTQQDKISTIKENPPRGNAELASVSKPLITTSTIITLASQGNVIGGIGHLIKNKYIGLSLASVIAPPALYYIYLNYFKNEHIQSNNPESLLNIEYNISEDEVEEFLIDALNYAEKLDKNDETKEFIDDLISAIEITENKKQSNLTGELITSNNSSIKRHKRDIPKENNKNNNNYTDFELISYINKKSMGHHSKNQIKRITKAYYEKKLQARKK